MSEIARRVFLTIVVGMQLVACAPDMRRGIGEAATTTTLVNQLGVSWYYNWGEEPARGETRAEFVPMAWDGGLAGPKQLAKLRVEPGSTACLLGFNEPERGDQAHMTVEEALALWPGLMATNRRLGSPAVSWDANGKRWLAAFMREADARRYRVDFICFHWYGDIAKPGAAGTLKAEIEKIHAAYNRPVWLTEFSGKDSYFKTPAQGVSENARFVAEVIPMLDSLPFLERYAWFTTTAYPGYITPALFSGEPPELTKVGRAYLRR